jgi:outer membrane protein assembly factor BamB
MKRLLLVLLFLLVASAIAFISWRMLRFTANSWEIVLDSLGSSSSPRAIDLTGDGILDIVIGAGYQEFVKTDRGILALNGKDGSMLWHVAARNQVVGSADFMDVTGDGVSDVFIGGRSALLYCLNGKNGDVIWEYMPDREGLDIYNDTTVLNFYNPQFINDIDDDGVRDLLISFGGFIKAKPHEVDRPYGYLLIMNSVTGKVLKQAKMPDGKEIYMSPVVFDSSNGGSPDIIYGTGGETVSGSLYRASLTDVMNEDLSRSIVLDSGTGKGFIAPPVLADITGDNVKDIIVNSVNGRVIAIDGKLNSKLWEASVGSGFEIYTTPAPGNFYGDDEVPDFFVSLGHGVWPEINYSINIVVDGRNGNTVYRDSSGTFQYASPVVYDMTGDGLDDVLFPLNTHATSNNVGGASFKYLQNELSLFDIHKKNRTLITLPRLGTNLGSTPLITDIDGDGRMDLIYAYSWDATSVFSFSKMKIERIEIPLKLNTAIQWGSYMGSDYSGIYPKND